MKVRIWSIITAVCVMLFAAACSETSSNEYKSYAEIQRAPPAARLWLPEFLPASATSIWESHNIDTSTVVGEFKFDLRELGAVTSRLTALPQEEAAKTRDQAKRLSKRVAISSNAKAFTWAPENKGRGLIVIEPLEAGAVFWTERR